MIITGILYNNDRIKLFRGAPPRSAYQDYFAYCPGTFEQVVEFLTDLRNLRRYMEEANSANGDKAK